MIYHINSGIIRLMITRGNTDKTIHTSNTPGMYISIKPFYKIPKSPVKVIYMNETDYPIIRFTPAIKSMNYIGNMLSKRECEKKQSFDNHNSIKAKYNYINKAVKIINSSKSVVIIAGGGIKYTSKYNNVIKLAELLNAPIVTAAGHG